MSDLPRHEFKTHEPLKHSFRTPSESDDLIKQYESEIEALQARVARLEEVLIQRDMVETLNGAVLWEAEVKDILNESPQQSLEEIKRAAIEEHCGNAFLVPRETANKIMSAGIMEAAAKLTTGATKHALYDYAQQLREG